MGIQIKTAPSFERELKKLKKRYPSIKSDFKQLLSDIEENPYFGTDLGKGLRKVRMAIASKGKGKSGGARVITFVTTRIADTVYLLYIYDKSDRENISSKELEALLKNNGLFTNE